MEKYTLQVKQLQTWTENRANFVPFLFKIFSNIPLLISGIEWEGRTKDKRQYKMPLAYGMTRTEIKTSHIFHD